MSSAVSVQNPAVSLIAPPAQGALLSLHRALEFRELWTSLQHLFETLVPHDTLVMSVNYLDWRREAPTQRLTSERSRVKEGGDTQLLVAQEGRAFFQPFLNRNAGISCYQHTQLMEDPRKIPQSRYYRRYMQPLGWRYSAHLLFWGDHGVETSFALRRRADQADFSAGEMDLFRAVHPHIGIAFERVRTFESERQRRRLLEGFYRAKPEAALFLDWDLKVLYASQEALAICAVWNLGAQRARAYAPHAVFAVPQILIASCDELKRQWRQQPSGASGREIGPLTAQAHANQSGYEAAVVLQREAGNTLGRPAFAIRLTGPETLTTSSPPANHARDRLLGQLTASERELAALVCAGLSNKDIAARLKKTEGSVKVQLSGVFAKLRVNSRAQLIVTLH